MFNKERLILLLLILTLFILTPLYASGQYIFPDEISNYSGQSQYNKASTKKTVHWTYPQYITDFDTSNIYKKENHYRYPGEVTQKNKYHSLRENNKYFRFSKPVYPSDLKPSNNTLTEKKYRDTSYNHFLPKVDDKYLDLESLFPRSERISPYF